MTFDALIGDAKKLDPEQIKAGMRWIADSEHFKSLVAVADRHVTELQSVATSPTSVSQGTVAHAAGALFEAIEWLNLLRSFHLDHEG